MFKNTLLKNIYSMIFKIPINRMKIRYNSYVIECLILLNMLEIVMKKMKNLKTNKIFNKIFKNIFNNFL